MHLNHLQRAPLITRTRHARACSTCNTPTSHNAPTHPNAHDNACVTQRDFHIHAHMHTYARAKDFSDQKFLPIRTFHLSTATKTCTLNSSITIKKRIYAHAPIRLNEISQLTQIHCAPLCGSHRIAFPNALLISFQYIHYSCFLNTYNLIIITFHMLH